MALMKLSRLNCGDQKFYLYLSSEPDNDRIDLTLSNAVKSWSGNVSGDDFISWSKKTKLQLSEYKKQTLKALSGEGLNGNEFVYDVTEEKDGSANLVWKRVLGGGDVKVQLGCVKLRPDLNLANSVRRILDSSIELTQKIQGQVESLTEERDRLASEREMALQRLEKYVSIKEDTEKDLYSKFVVVLNSKKSKIRELREQLEKVQSTTATSSATSSSAKGKGTATVRKGPAIHSLSESESEESDHAMTNSPKPDNVSDMEYNTDDELESSSSTAGKVWNRGNRSNVGKTKDQTKEDDDLMLDDGEDDDDDVAVVPKRSRKPKQETVRKTASKTVIPHTEGSAEGQPSTSRKSSVRKSSSKGSSTNLDVSNLIDDMD